MSDRSNMIPVPGRPNTFRVEANVPIPSARRGRERAPCPFPFSTMKPGDSFLVGPYDDEKVINQARNWAQIFSKETGAKYITREVSDQFLKGRYWRVWRVAPATSEQP